METKAPLLAEAKQFAEGVHAVNPHAMLAYNLSPSFNWSGAGLADDNIARLQTELGKLGFCWQFITLAGFHVNSLAITRFGRSFSSQHMLAYVNGVQRPEAAEDVATLTHQKWSGAELVDAEVHVVTGGAGSTAAMGHGNTEQQFASSSSKIQLSKL